MNIQRIRLLRTIFLVVVTWLGIQCCARAAYVGTVSTTNNLVFDINPNSANTNYYVVDQKALWLFDKGSSAVGTNALTSNFTGTGRWLWQWTGGNGGGLWTDFTTFIAPTAATNSMQLWTNGALFTGPETLAAYGAAGGNEALVSYSLDNNTRFLSIQSQASTNSAILGTVQAYTATNNANLLAQLVNPITGLSRTFVVNNQTAPLGDLFDLEMISAGNIEFKVLPPTGWSGSGTNWFGDDGKFHSTTFNTNGGNVAGTFTVPYYPRASGVNTLTDGALYASGSDVALDSKFIWGPGTTNVLYRSGSDLIITNGNPLGFNLRLKDVSGYDIFYGANGAGAPHITTTGPNQPVYLNAGGASGGLVVGANALQPGTETIQIGTSASNGAFTNAFIKGQTHIVAENDGSGNYSWMSVFSTNGIGIFDLENSGTGTPWTKFSFRSNGVEVASLPGGGSGGTTINPTDGFFPYRVDATTFGDSPLYRVNSNQVRVTNYKPVFSITDTNTGGNPTFAVAKNGFETDIYGGVPMIIGNSVVDPRFYIDSTDIYGMNAATNIFRVSRNSGYTGTGANVLTDDGTYKASGGGGGTVGTMVNTNGSPGTGALSMAFDTSGTNWGPTSLISLGGTNLSLGSSFNSGRLNIGLPMGAANTSIAFAPPLYATPAFFTYGASTPQVDGGTNFLYSFGYNKGVTGQYDATQMGYSPINWETHWDPDGFPRMEWYSEWINPGGTKHWRPMSGYIYDDGTASNFEVKAHRIQFSDTAGTNDMWVFWDQNGVLQTLNGGLLIKTNAVHNGWMELRGGTLYIKDSAQAKGSYYQMSGGNFYVANIGSLSYNWLGFTGYSMDQNLTLSGSSQLLLGGSDVGLTKDATSLLRVSNGSTGLGSVRANTNFINELIVTNGITLGGVRNTTWPAGGSGNMVNSGASAVNDVPVYTDVSGTALTPTNTLFLTGLSVTNRVPFYSGIFVPNATNIVSRNGVNSADVPLIGIDTNDVVQVSDATHDTTLNGQYVHVPGRLLAGSGVFTNTLNVSNLTVTASGDFNEMNAGTLFLSNMVANVVPVFDGNTNLVPSTTTTNDLLSLHNMFTTTGATVAGPILTTSPTTNGPSTLELASAGWVRSLLNNGTFLYNSTNVVGTAFDASTYLYVANQPTNGSRSYTPAAGDYIGSVMTTQRFEQVSGPVHIASWFTSSGGASSAQYTLHPEIYYTYDTNSATLLGDYTSAPQAITHGAITNEYDFVVSFPTIVNTNTPGNGFYLVRRFKIDTKTGTDTLKLSLGTNGVNNTPAHIDFTQPAVAGANWVASGTTDSTLAGNASMVSANVGKLTTTNTTSAKLTTTWAASSNGTNYVADLSLPSLHFNMTTNINLLHSTNGTANFTAGYSMVSSIKVVNNSGTNFPIAWPATWHTVGSMASGMTLTNNDYCVIGINFVGVSQDQTNNWISIGYKQF